MSQATNPQGEFGPGPSWHHCTAARWHLKGPRLSGYWWKVVIRQSSAVPIKRSACVYYMARDLELPVRRQSYPVCDVTMTLRGAITLVERTIAKWEGTDTDEQDGSSKT